MKNGLITIRANLCKCNNCGTIMIDQNPQVGAIMYPLKGDEAEMQYFPGLIEDKEEGLFWGCPVCETDAYLIDL